MAHEALRRASPAPLTAVFNDVLRTLKPLRSATIEINGVVTTIPPALNSDEAEIIEALIASHPALRGREVLRFPYQTRAFWFARH